MLLNHVALTARALADDGLLPTATLSLEEQAEIDKMAIPLPKPNLDDFDGMKQRRLIRVLVVASKTRYFIDKGRELGIDAETARAFEDEINKKYKTKALRIHVALFPVSRDKLLPDLIAGIGDIAAGALTITPDRQQLVEFTDPSRDNVNEIVVTGPTAAQLKTLDDLAGQTILVRKSSSYFTHLDALSKTFQNRNLAPITLEAAAEDLEDEDLMEMVNAGLLPLVVVDRYKARFWAQLYKNIKPREDLIINEGGEIAIAIRKNSPLLKAELNAFVKTHRIGTSFGNTLARRYLQSTKMMTDAYSTEEMGRFQKLVDLFAKYGSTYQFNELMLMAQGYQESQLDQSRRSPRGAVGIMQMLPATAADPAINITGIDSNAARNIEAGAKYMALLRDKYLSDPAINDKNKTLMTFAAYNAGPGNLAKFRRLAAKSGLDPNIWFNNVELAAAKIVGQETVKYVGSIYKYYIAYELVRRREANRARQKAAIAAGPALGDGAGDLLAPIAAAPGSTSASTP
jgi:membrane-bound lytic murein transglycosylase MltF